MSFWENTLLFAKDKVSFLTRRLLFLFIFLFLYTVFLTIYSWTTSIDDFKLLNIYAQLVPLLFYVIIIHILIKNQKTLNRRPHQLTPLDKKDKYEKTGLSEAFSIELKNKLEHLMDKQKLYLNHELRLDDIAELLNISRHHASQVINENFNMSFYEFINAYRIEEAKNKLCSGFENSSESISDIAYQCGFNNRVSFYKAFKKITHITPKEFIQKAA
ncbi:MAG: AraC family transcriptional regulator [Muricauda sp.]|nr:helix-turn-helix domain-containing protein [Allomuricauda sp.]MBA4744853.1 AraC family transcriptional regulator [Allomuricauda sp.]